VKGAFGDSKLLNPLNSDTKVAHISGGPCLVILGHPVKYWSTSIKERFYLFGFKLSSSFTLIKSP